uniref:Uncharacterized protein n=1 Tax=Musa acuminata subsp. malaccensis TaxID=214687 RepID=A0A804JST0_MUSAM
MPRMLFKDLRYKRVSRRIGCIPVGQPSGSALGQL